MFVWPLNRSSDGELDSGGATLSARVLKKLRGNMKTLALSLYVQLAPIGWRSCTSMLVELLFAQLLPSCLNEADRRLLGAGGGGVPVQVPVVDAQGCQIRVNDAVALVVWISIPFGVPSSAAFNLVLVR